MADPGRTTPFRRVASLGPIIVPVIERTMPFAPTPVDMEALIAAGVTSFKVVNECPFFVWYRSWQGDAAMTADDVFENAHYLAPGMTDVNGSLLPSFIAAVAADTFAWPIYNDDGSYRFAGKQMRLVFLNGSGM